MLLEGEHLNNLKGYSSSVHALTRALAVSSPARQAVSAIKREQVQKGYMQIFCDLCYMGDSAEVGLSAKNVSPIKGHFAKTLADLYH